MQSAGGALFIPFAMPRRAQPYTGYTIGHDIGVFGLSGLHASVITPTAVIVSACLLVCRYMPK